MTPNTNTPNPSQAWQQWRSLSDELVVRLAIDAASRRIASQFGR